MYILFFYSPEGQAGLQCLFDFYKSCPDLASQNPDIPTPESYQQMCAMTGGGKYSVGTMPTS